MAVFNLSRKKTMEDNGWTQVSPGVYIANNSAASARAAQSNTDNDQDTRRIERELAEFKAAKATQRVTDSRNRR